MEYTFKKGVHPHGNKDITKDIPLSDFPVPKTLEIPLSQHIGTPAEAVVTIGDNVKAGTLIGKASGFVSANVYASVSGRVSALIEKRTATGVRCSHVVIENDGLYEEELLPKPEQLTADSIKTRVQEAGIVGMGGATFPTHVKLSPRSKVDTLIINVAECEPYITCDYRLCIEHTMEIIEGTRYMMTALGVSHAFIGVERNKPEAITELDRLCPDNITIVPLKTKYPQGAEKQLIYSILRRVVPCGALPAEVGVVVDNAHTAFAVYEAVALGKPSYRRALTVSGRAVGKPGNFWVATGVSYADIAAEQEIMPTTVKVISGGPMMGFAQPDLTPAVGKGTSSILFLSKKENCDDEISACINCAACANHCPMNLMPMFIDTAAATENAQAAKDLGVVNCIECGCCSYVCPAKRPLVQSMRRGKRLIKEKRS